LLTYGRWFSPGTQASSTTKTDRHDIAEILLKVALKNKKSNQIKPIKIVSYMLQAGPALSQWIQLLSNGPRVRVIYFRMFEYTQHTAGFTQLLNFITYGCESIAPLFCNLQSLARTHAVLVIGLYELLSSPTT
jgi:hypothetical protein